MTAALAGAGLAVAATCACAWWADARRRSRLRAWRAIRKPKKLSETAGMRQACAFPGEWRAG